MTIIYTNLPVETDMSLLAPEVKLLDSNSDVINYYSYLSNYLDFAIVILLLT